MNYCCDRGDSFSYKEMGERPDILVLGYIGMNVYTPIGFDNAEEELKQIEKLLKGTGRYREE